MDEAKDRLVYERAVLQHGTAALVAVRIVYGLRGKLIGYLFVYMPRGRE